MHDGLEYGGPSAAIGKTDLTDEQIRLKCLEYASRNTNPHLISCLSDAKDMYDWVKAGAQLGEKWNIKSNEAKYSYDLTGCAGNSKTVVAEEPKQ